MRFLRLVLVASGLAFLGAQAACTAKDNLAFLIIQNQVPEEGCVIPAQLGDTFRGTGQLDVAPLPDGRLNPGYLFTPALRNGSKIDSTQPTANMIVLEGADIELVAGTTTASKALVDALAAADLDKRTQLISGTVAPGSVSSVGFYAIDADQTAAIAGMLGPNEQVTLIARVSVFGRIDGSEIVTGDFNYPVTVCNGCASENLGSCSAIAADEIIGAGGVCNPLQDGFLSCCDSATGIRCPARSD